MLRETLSAPLSDEQPCQTSRMEPMAHEPTIWNRLPQGLSRLNPWLLNPFDRLWSRNPDHMLVGHVGLAGCGLWQRVGSLAHACSYAWCVSSIYSQYVHAKITGETYAQAYLMASCHHVNYHVTIQVVCYIM
jgi:hypothetical protein